MGWSRHFLAFLFKVDPKTIRNWEAHRTELPQEPADWLLETARRFRANPPPDMTWPGRPKHYGPQFINRRAG